MTTTLFVRGLRLGVEWDGGYVDEGIGWHEYWGSRRFHSDIVWEFDLYGLTVSRNGRERVVDVNKLSMKTYEQISEWVKEEDNN